jgi:hypothetical protein
MAGRKPWPGANRLAAGVPRGTHDEFVERCRRERQAAGLPPRVEDETALDKIATIVLGADNNRAA